MVPIIFAKQFDHQGINAKVIRRLADPLKQGVEDILDSTLTYD
jgi:hypothetical protein